MVIAERIQATVQRLPVSLQVEALDYIEYLLAKLEREASDDSNLSASQISLALAMRGMEDEDTPDYSIDDLKVVF